MTVQDGRNSQKKAWKAFQANYDDVFALSDRYCSYCLTDQQVQALLTMTEYLKWPTRWVAALPADIDPVVIDQFTSGLEYQLMNGCCDDNLPIQWRYSADGTLQQSLNGGGTWADAPLYDPRVYSPTFPPMTGDDEDDNKCIASTGMVALIKEQVGDQLTDDMTRYTLGQLITDWVATMIQSSNPFEALVTVVTNQIFALVIAVLRPALTDAVYDTLQCIFYCNLLSDISFDTAKWQKTRSDITAQIGGIAGIFLEHLVYLLGEKGCTNLARAGGASAGDCSDCPECGCAAALGFETSGYSTVLSWDEDTCTVTLQSVPDVAHPGWQVLGFDFGLGCGVPAIISTSTDLSFPSWFPCGGSSEVTHGLYSTQSVNYFYFGGYSYLTEPYTAVIQITAP